MLRDDVLLAVAAGKRDATGERRKRKRDRGHALAGKSTLNRLERTPAEATRASRYKKIVCVGEEVERFFVREFLAAHRRPPKEIVLDLDATDDPVQGLEANAITNDPEVPFCSVARDGASPAVDEKGVGRDSSCQSDTILSIERQDGRELRADRQKARLEEFRIPNHKALRREI